MTGEVPDVPPPRPSPTRGEAGRNVQKKSPGGSKEPPGRGRTDLVAIRPSGGDVAVGQDVALLEELVDDRVDALLDRLRARVDRDLGVRRRLVGVVDAGEALDLAG